MRASKSVFQEGSHTVSERQQVFANLFKNCPWIVIPFHSPTSSGIVRG